MKCMGKEHLCTAAEVVWLVLGGIQTQHLWSSPGSQMGPKHWTNLNILYCNKWKNVFTVITSQINVAQPQINVFVWAWEALIGINLSCNPFSFFFFFFSTPAYERWMVSGARKKRVVKGLLDCIRPQMIWEMSRRTEENIWQQHRGSSRRGIHRLFLAW